MSRKVITVPGAAAAGPYSQGIDADGVIFLSGQIPLDTETKQLVTGGIGAQTEQCFRNLKAVLEAAGLTLGDMQKVTVYLRT